MQRVRIWCWVALVATAAFGGCRGVLPAGPSAIAGQPDARPGTTTAVPTPPCYTTYCYTNPIQPRWQWNANYGYCGEEATIAAAMYYGEYASQYLVRKLTTGRQWSATPSNSELLLGIDALKAATAMHMTAVPFTYAYVGPSGDQWTTQQFLLWVKQNVLRGYPVAVGVYENSTVLGGAQGDSEYDHIVSVIGVGSNHAFAPGAQTFYNGDYLIFSDNGLYGPNPPAKLPYKHLPPFYFPNTFTTSSYSDDDTYAKYNFKVFARTRTAATNSSASYSMPLNTAANNSPGNYGIAVTGVMDSSRETLPVRLTVNRLLEFPYIAQGNGSNANPSPPPPQAIALSVTVSGLRAGKSYNLYEYDGLKDTFPAVPNGRFNAQAAAATNSWSFTATGATYTVSPTPKPGGSYLSNDAVVFRAVSASAP